MYDMLAKKVFDGTASDAERIYHLMLVMKEHGLEHGVRVGIAVVRKAVVNDKEVYNIYYQRNGLGQYRFASMIPFTVSSLYEAAYAVEMIHCMA